MTFAIVVMTDLVGIKKLPQLMTLTFPIVGAFRFTVISTSGKFKLLLPFFSINIGRFKQVPCSWVPGIYFME